MTHNEKSILKTSDFVDQTLAESATQVRLSREARDPPSPYKMKAEPATVKGRIDLQSKFRKTANQSFLSFESGDNHIISEMLERETNSEIEMRRTIRQLTEALTTQQKDRDALMSVIKDLKMQQPETIDTDARLKILQQETEMHNAFNEINTLQQEKTAFEKLIEQLKEQIAEMQVSLQTQNQSSFESEKGFQELQERYKAVQQMHESEQSQIKDLESVLLAKEHEISQFAIVRREYEQQIGDLFEENKQLNYTIEDLKGKIRIAVRVRPTDAAKMQLIYPDFTTYKKTLSLTLTSRSVDGREKLVSDNYVFDRVFRDEEMQESIFEEYMPLIQQVFSGHKVLLAAYGQSGSGKTYTMFGSEENSGLMPNSIEYIYKQLSSCQQRDPQISASFFEIYNDRIFDLLARDLGSSAIEQRPGECKVGISDTGVVIKNLSRIPVSSEAELLGLVSLTLSRRRTSATVLNDTSSRSHAVFTINIEEIVDNEEITGSLTLVDLAGSEQIEGAAVDAARKQESIYINKSLSALGNVFLGLAGRAQHVAFRDSALTSVLQEYFQGDSKAVMIVCLNAARDCQAEGVNSLKFAQRIKAVNLKK